MLNFLLGVVIGIVFGVWFQNTIDRPDTVINGKLKQKKTVNSEQVMQVKKEKTKNKQNRFDKLKKIFKKNR